MKRPVCLILVFLLLLPGCAIGQERHKEPVTFYYLRSHEDADDYQSFFSDGAIGSETREASGHRQDLNYLLAMYLQGPLREDLQSPFPTGCRTVEIGQDGTALTIRLNAVMAQLGEMELTVASACLAKTCFALADVNTVHVEARSAGDDILFTRSFTTDNLLLEDSWTQPPEATD